ncbi:MAG: adenylyl-sulfate kinase [Gemmatimonadota bacterium]
MPTSKHIYWVKGSVSRHDREAAQGHRGVTLWLTGLSGSGKSTLARSLDEALFHRGCKTFILDGDNVRHGLSRDLGFSPEDRTENIRRIGEVAKLFTNAGTIVLTAFISPYRADRDGVRAIMGNGDFIEVHVDAPLEVCEERDPKGLYKKARAGEIPNFTGIDAPYEEPADPEVRVRTGERSVEECVAEVIEYLEENGYLGGEGARRG